MADLGFVFDDSGYDDSDLDDWDVTGNYGAYDTAGDPSMSLDDDDGAFRDTSDYDQVDLELLDASPLEKFSVFTESEIIQRRLYISSEMMTVLQACFHEDVVQHLLPLIGRLANDPDSAVRQNVAQRLSQLGQYFINRISEFPSELDDVLHIFRIFIAPIFVLHLIDSEVLVATAAHESFIALIKLIYDYKSENERVFKALSFMKDSTETLPVSPPKPQAEWQRRLVPLLLESVVVQLVQYDSIEPNGDMDYGKKDEESKCASLELMKDLCATLSAEISKITFLPWLDVLYTSPHFNVRKQCATLIGSLSPIVDDSELDHLFGIFDSLVQDGVWNVRKACAEALPELASRLSGADRCQKLLPIFIRLTEDVSRWVVAAAYDGIGKFIFSFKDDGVPDELMGLYLSMTSISQNLAKAKEVDRSFKCAFAFPAVLIAIGGGDKWDDVKDAFMILTFDPSPQVRRTLAHSLHEVARIIGSERTMKDLVGVFDRFISDIDEVKLGVLGHITDFLSCLNEDVREPYLFTLDRLREGVEGWRLNWRTRKAIASQFGSIAKLYTPFSIAQYIVPMAFKLAMDDVADVREASVLNLAQVLIHIKSLNAEPWLGNIVSGVSEFASKPNYQLRIFFVQCCEVLVTDPLGAELFDAHFMKLFIQLGSDPVPNVRINIARALSRTIVKIDRYKSLWQANSEPTPLHELTIRLRTDTDPDVSALIASAAPIRAKRRSKANHVGSKSGNDGDGSDEERPRTMFCLDDVESIAVLDKPSPSPKREPVRSPLSPNGKSPVRLEIPPLALEQPSASVPEHAIIKAEESLQVKIERDQPKSPMIKVQMDGVVVVRKGDVSPISPVSAGALPMPDLDISK
ncbi:armadillo-type protein [Polychytrium aggregatum]|uniref:armadillo-type protein n=1 Tax=Polychytrium aggregatum TaxID=110093 RepID=UPI0022FE8502|nr:armadillo-type protein [Polychytrium aggregatum]KAI9204640.1 armadillo-type protein [Polychytrium aggregatum]